METTEQTQDTTNKKVYNKIIEGFNKVLKETHSIGIDTSKIWDKMSPTYTNVHILIDALNNLEKKIDKLNSKVSDLQTEVERLKFR